MEEIKVIFHVDELNKWDMVLKNVSNLLHAGEIEKLKVEVLANGEAVKFYDLTADLKRDVSVMEKLNANGVRFVACNNALNGLKIKREALIKFIEIVPVGVLEIIKKQNEGFAYIKP